MGATTIDLFGTAASPSPATPGSYGEAPSGYRLPDATRLGPVRLQIADLSRSLAYYQHVLGMRVVEREGSRAVLAAGDDTPLVELNERAGASPGSHRGRLGLYHFAILLPDRPSLGRFVRHLAEIGVRAGAGDHLVSEAFYLQDPDDLGMPAGTVMGHVHLHVGDLAQGAAFYHQALGFDRITWRYPGALFLGAGGYHHHLGTNTWAGVGARPPAEDEVRLLEWTIELPDAGSLEGVARSLADAGYPVERRDASEQGGTSAPDVVTRDPWGTAIRLREARAAAG